MGRVDYILDGGDIDFAISEGVFGTIDPKVPIMTDKGKVVSLLEPGDIINTRRMYSKIGTGPFNLLISAGQQEFFPHTTVYPGHGRLANPRLRGFEITPISEYLDKGPSIVLRVKAPLTTRMEAARYVEEHFKNRSVSFAAQVKAGVGLWKRKLTGTGVRSAKGKMICSTAIAKAFSSLGYPLAKRTATALTTPRDIARSPRVEQVLIYTPQEHAKTVERNVGK